jgi:hypothetical protein
MIAIAITRGGHHEPLPGRYLLAMRDRGAPDERGEPGQ